MKIYLGGPMFDAPNVIYNLNLARKLRDIGFQVYCPNENSSINDKTRTDITPEAVYRADLLELRSSNIFLCQVSEDSGTNWEAGYMDCLATLVDPEKYVGVIGLATDIRLSTPPNPARTGADNQAWALNAFISGALKSSLGIFTTEDSLVEHLHKLLAESKQ